MRKFAVLTALVTALVTALTISPAASPATGTAATSAPALAGSQAVGTAQITYEVKKFSAKNGRLFAHGYVVATVKTEDGTHVARKPFKSRVIRASSASQRKALSTARVCDVLNLTLGPIHLELLGLIIDLNQVVLTIKADSQGGLLGSLLCGLAGGPPLGTQKVAKALTQEAQTSGLAGGKVTYPPQTLVAQGLLPPVPEGICTVLDLVLGPLHLELLGLIVDLNQVHLRITADPNGGLLGSLLCGLSGGPAGG